MATAEPPVEMATTATAPRVSSQWPAACPGANYIIVFRAHGGN